MDTFKAIYWPFLKKIIINTLVVIAFAGLTQLIRPLLLVTVIITIFSLGLFSLLVRTLLVYSVSYILSPHFEIASFWTAVGLVLVIKIFNFIFNTNERTIIIKTFKK